VVNKIGDCTSFRGYYYNSEGNPNLKVEQECLRHKTLSSGFVLNKKPALTPSN